MNLLGSNRGDDLVVVFLSEPFSDPFVQFLCSSVDGMAKKTLWSRSFPISSNGAVTSSIALTSVETRILFGNGNPTSTAHEKSRRAHVSQLPVQPHRKR